MKNIKRIVYQFAIVTVLLAGSTSCNGFTTETDDIVNSDEVKEIIITDDQAKTRFESYGEHRGKIIEIYENNGRSFGDSISQNLQSIKGEKQEDMEEEPDAKKGFVPVQYSSYDFEQLKKYLTYIEQQTKKAGADISTMRIYFTNYPASEADRNKQKRNSVMFVPTINVNGNESAYYISDDGDSEKSRPYLLNNSFERTGKPAATGSNTIYRNSNEANLLPNMPNFTNMSPPAFFAERSVIGNEGSLHPPSYN